jgi:hypothetical protein
MTVHATTLESHSSQAHRALSILTRPGSCRALFHLLSAGKTLMTEDESGDLYRLTDELRTRSNSSWAHLPQAAIIGLISGSDHDWNNLCSAEVERWRDTHLVALQFWRALLERAPSMLRYLQRMGTPWPQWGAFDLPCPACGMPVEASQYVLEESRSTRVTFQCLRCGTISDGPESLGQLRLVVPLLLAPGARAAWSIELDNHQPHSSYYAAIATIEKVPWNVVENTEAIDCWSPDSGDKVRLEGSLRISPDALEGWYSMLALVLANGEPCFARQPIRISRRLRSDYGLTTCN